MTTKKRRNFTVVYEPDEGGWHAEIHEVPGCHTWGRSLGAARPYIREALATCVDQFGDDVDRVARDAVLEDDIRLPKAAAGVVKAALKARQHLEAEEAKVGEITRKAVRALVEEAGLSTRDASEVLGLSHQRIQQLKAG